MLYHQVFVQHISIQYKHCSCPMHHPATFSLLIHTSATVTTRLPLRHTVPRCYNRLQQGVTT